MRFVVWCVLLLATLVKVAGAQGFSSELKLEYISGESDSSDLDRYDITYTYYFSELKADTGPLAVAEFIGRASSLEIVYSQTNQNFDVSGNELDGQQFSLTGQYYESDYGVGVGVLESGADLDYGASTATADIDGRLYLLSATLYPEQNTRVLLGYIWGESEIDYSFSFTNDKVDLEQLFVYFENLMFLEGNRYLKVDVLIAQFSEDEAGVTEDTTFIDLTAAYYFDRFRGVHVNYEVGNGEGPDEYSEYGINYEHFLNGRAAISLGYLHTVDNTAADSGEYSLTYTQRF